MAKVQKVEKMLAKMQQNYKNSSTNGSLANGALDVTSNFSLEIGIALIVFGILCGFLGKRFVKPVSFLGGFLLGAGMSLGLAALKLMSSATVRTLSSTEVVVIAGAGGIILGTLMLAFYKLIIYGILGGFIAVISALLCWEFTNKAAILQYPVASIAFILGTFFASLVPTFSMIVVTSGIGSYLLTVGIDCILKSGFNHVFAFGFGYKWSEVATNTSDEIFGLLVFWIVMFLWMGISKLFSKENQSGKMGKFKVKNNNNNNNITTLNGKESV